MLSSCKYCGRIHKKSYDCGKKPTRKKKVNEKDRFRWTRVWQKKREEIKARDKYLCQICIREKRFNYDDLEVHHAIPLEKDFEKRLDNNNLITLCSYHHELAENGKIPLEDIFKIINVQEGTPQGVLVEK